MKPKRIIAWFLVVAASNTVWSSYLFMSRLTRSFSTATDYAALAAALAVGIAGIFILVRAPRTRAWAAALYVLLVGGTMYVSLLSSLCAAGECG